MIKLYSCQHLLCVKLSLQSCMIETLKW
jgi:hypothetical protein